MCIALDTLWLAYFGHCPEAKLIHSVESTDLIYISSEIVKIFARVLFSFPLVMKLHPFLHPILHISFY